MADRLSDDKIVVESELYNKESNLIWIVTLNTKDHVALLLDLGWSDEPKVMVVPKSSLTTDVWTSWEHTVEDAQYNGWGYQG